MTPTDAVFINPSFGYPVIKDKGLYYTKMWPPLSLAYGAAIMEARGLRVRMIDAQAERLGPDEVARRAAGAGRVFITSSPLDRWQCPVNDIRNVYEVIDRLKAADPGRPIFLIGAHGTSFPEKILRETPVDAVIIGEPESAIKDLAEGRPIGEIEGIAVRDGDRVSLRPRQTFLSLNEFPLPAFHLLPMDRYHFEFLGRHFALLEVSRGCYYNCTFCYKEMYGRYRVKTSANIIRELDDAIDRFGVRNIYFADLTFTGNRKQVLDICAHLAGRKPRVHWACQTRFDAVDEDLLRKMAEAGCRLIQFGIESETEEITRRTRKYIPPKTITEGLAAVRRLGIESVAFYMFGLPGETAEDMRRSQKQAERLNPTYVAYNIAIPYLETVRSPLPVAPENRGIFFPDSHGAYAKEFLEKMVRKAMISFYLHPRTIPKVLRHPGSLAKKIRIFLGAI